VSEFEGRVEAVDKTDEGQKVALGVRPQANAVVDKTPEKGWQWTCVLGEDLGLHVTDEQACVAGAHTGAHSHTAGLDEVSVPELEGVQCQNELGKA